MNGTTTAGDGSHGTRRPVVAGLACVVAMAGYLVARTAVDGVVQAVLSVGLVAVAVGLAVWAGATAGDLGVAVRDLPSGALWGGVVGLALAALIGAASLLSPTEGFFDDDRYADVDGADLAFEVLVRVPLGTALFEELLFRGVLLALAMMLAGRLVAVVSSSVLFGLWHVLAASDFADTNDGVGSTAVVGVVVGTVVVTGVAGVGLAWLRLRSRSVLAPTIVHAAVNSTALLLAATAS